jgi:hypothetical protein
MASIFHDIYMVKQGGEIAIFVFFYKKKKKKFISTQIQKKIIIFFTSMYIENKLIS